MSDCIYSCVLSVPVSEALPLPVYISYDCWHMMWRSPIPPGQMICFIFWHTTIIYIILYTFHSEQIIHLYSKNVCRCSKNILQLLSNNPSTKYVFMLYSFIQILINRPEIKSKGQSTRAKSPKCAQQNFVLRQFLWFLPSSRQTLKPPAKQQNAKNSATRNIAKKWVNLWVGIEKWIWEIW